MPSRQPMCSVCGAEVTDRARYCSNACRQRAYRSRGKGTTAEPRTAPPATLDSFVGREDELHEINRLLRRVRLVTLSGPGGVGKSRLAQEIAARHVDAEIVDIATCSSKGLAESFAAERKGLVVLDNCELDIDFSARFATSLLSHCPALRVLATSREPLLVPGETVVVVHALSSDAAVTLFHDRAQAAVPHSDVIDKICLHLDRLPLAIELAANLVRALPPAELLARLEHRLDLLTVGRRTAPARHQSLRAAIAGSYHSLTGTEQRVFRGLSVLPGAFTLDTAATVCDVAPALLPPVVAVLVAKSLVTAENGRYRLLESIRAYAGERLTDAGQRDAARERLLRWLSGLVRDFTEPVFTPSGWLKQLVDDAESLVLGLDWAIQDGRCELPLATTLSICWWSLGDTAKGRRLLHDSLTRTDGPPGDRCLALTYAGWLASAEGDHDEALVFTEAAVEAARAADDRAQLGRSLSVLATVHLARGDVARARTTYGDCLAVLDSPLDRATCLHNLAWAVLQDGDLVLAEALVNRALPVYRLYAERDRLPSVLHTAGAVAVRRGDVRRAETLFLEALRIAQHDDRELAHLVEGLAVVAARSGESERALRLIGAIAALRLPVEHNPGWQRLVEKTERFARDRLPDATARVAVADGGRLGRDQIVAYALHREWPDFFVGSPLTPREREIAALVARGDTNRQIAKNVRLSERTVEAHLARIREKLGLRTRTQVAAWLLSASA